FREFDRAQGMMRTKQPRCTLIVLARHAETSGYGMRCYVLMTAADAADREDVRVALPKSDHFFNNVSFIVGDKTHSHETHADRRDHICQLTDVPVLGPAGKDLVTYYDHGGGDDFSHGMPRRDS